jgi:hypothetical protein
VKKKLAVFGAIMCLALVPACGGSRAKAPSAKQYAKMRYAYGQILDEYASELNLADSTDEAAIRRCVLGHADETRRHLGGGSMINGTFHRYASYPFLEYTAELRATISELERMSAQLTSPGSSSLMHQLAHDMQNTARALCAFKGSVVADARYLKEQDKWDDAQQAKSQQAMVNLLVANSMAPQKILHEVRVREVK